VLTGRRLGHHTATAKRSPRDVPPLDRDAVAHPDLGDRNEMDCRVEPSVART